MAHARAPEPVASVCYAPGYDPKLVGEIPPGTIAEDFVVFGTSWPAVDGRVMITYSYSNLLNGGMGLASATLRSVVEEALGVWAAKSPLDFVEVPDSGPLPSPGDPIYSEDGHPHLRFGHHTFDGPGGILAHAFFPPPNGGGLAGDVHFDSAENWTTDPLSGFDVLEVCVHEIGHALGLRHEPSPPQGNEAIMNAFYGRRYSGPGTAFLFTDDCQGIVSIYGENANAIDIFFNDECDGMHFDLNELPLIVGNQTGCLSEPLMGFVDDNVLVIFIDQGQIIDVYLLDFDLNWVQFRAEDGGPFMFIRSGTWWFGTPAP